MFLTHYSTNDIDRVFRHTVNLFDQMESILNDQSFTSTTTSSFPPHNIRKKDNSYLIEMAVAGFSKEDLNIKREKNHLVIEGKKSEKDEDGFVYRGIANRSFKKTFVLGEHMEIIAADVKDGMLLVGLEYHVPEDQKPQQIVIGERNEKMSKIIENVKKLIA